MNLRPSSSKLALLLAVALLLAACAAPRGGSAPRETGSAGGDSGDNCGSWLVVGAIGGIFSQGGKGTRDKVGGGLIGGAAAYALCKAITSAKYSVQQTKTEQQVRDEYLRTAGRTPPTTPTVAAHGIQVKQERGRDARGRGVTLVNVRSDISVVAGGQSTPRVEEQVVLIAPDGKTRLGDIKKTAGSTGGAYGATTQITMPDGLEDGQYEIRHIVLLDNAAKSERTARFSYVAGAPVMPGYLAWVDAGVDGAALR